ncbi:MAG: succinate dehydrogenase assembly factor 2 [Pseudomonadota bacterium]
MSEKFEIRHKRALFRATHRGTKEMDWMLGRYAEAKLAEMPDASLSNFELLLTVSDQEINDWLLNRENCDNPRYQELVADIRIFHKLDNAA